MVYGSETVLPPEIGIKIALNSIYNPEGNTLALVEELDLVEER